MDDICLNISNDISVWFAANGIALDECHGIEIDAEGQQYAYIANDVYPYIMGCYRGEPSLVNSFQMYECTGKVVFSLNTFYRVVL